MASPYNIFMKAELARLKAADPTLEHKPAFKQAAANWKKLSKEQRQEQATIPPQKQNPKELLNELCDADEILQGLNEKLGIDGRASCLQLKAKIDALLEEMQPLFIELNNECYPGL